MMPGDYTIPKSRQPKGTKFLDRFVGRWSGEGMVDGKEVLDEMQYEWTADRRFLHVNIQQLEGGDFKAEGYFWHDHAQDRFEFYEVNNGRWPSRMMRGALTKGRLSLEWHGSGCHTRTIIEWISPTMFRLTESYIRGRKSELFVDETYQRKLSKRKPSKRKLGE